MDMKKIIIVLGLLLVPLTTVVGQNKLEKSKNELDSRSTSSSSSSKGARSGSVDDFDSGLGSISLAVFKYFLIGDYRNENHLSSNLTIYPYYNGTSGSYERYETDTLKSRQSRVEMESKFIYSNHTLYGIHLKTRVRPFQYFYFQGDYRQLYEVNRIENTSDNLGLYHLSLNYDRLRFEKFNLGWNLGVSYVGNQVKEAGFAYGVAADYFMDSRISFGVSQRWSNINNSPVNDFELQSRYHRSNYYFSLGYQRLKIASPVYHFIGLGGGIYF